MDEKIVEEIKEKIKRGEKSNIDSNDRARTLGFKTQEEAKEYLDNIFIEYSFQCYGEKLPDGCYRLANYHENITHKFDEAAKLHKKMCDDHNYARCCYHYANATMIGRGCKKDITESYKYNLKACNLNVARSCFRSGLLAFYGQEVPQNTELGVKCLEKACDLNEPEGCLQLFQAYLNGDRVQKDPFKALEYTKKACSLGHLYGCVNASVMYKKGDGIPKDEALAQSFREKAEEIQNIFQKPQPGVVFGEQHKN